MKKEIIYIDMDGVTANFDKAILSIDPTIKTLAMGGDDYESRAARVDTIVLANPQIFENLEPIDGSVETIKRLAEDYEVYFCQRLWIIALSLLLVKNVG